jgi:hypothetical protein
LPGDRGAHFDSRGQNGALPGANRTMGKLQAKNSGTFQECLDNAIQWERRAASVRDPAAKAVFVELSRSWMKVARSWRDLQKPPAKQVPLID